MHLYFNMFDKLSHQDSSRISKISSAKLIHEAVFWSAKFLSKFVYCAYYYVSRKLLSRKTLIDNSITSQVSVNNFKKSINQFLPNPIERNKYVSSLYKIAEKSLDLIIAEADKSRQKVFDLLGSGSKPLGNKLDWHTDFKSGYRWNPKIYYKLIRPASYPGGYDIKVPWELSRCQHFVRLGQAYWITGDEKYPHEFTRQVEHWITSNPWPWGVNWASTMDVAIRAVNWLWGYAFFETSASLDDRFRNIFLKSLQEHGRHIYHNLENNGEITGNHYTADLVGLIYLGILCPQLKNAQAWRDFGLRELEVEMLKQVNADGVHFEGSVSYHRLVLEMFLSATLLAQHNGHAFSQSFLQRLEKMVEFIMHITKPDGTVPLIGDNDNGRLHRLMVWERSSQEWVDYRYLLAIGAVMFQRDDFAQAAEGQWQDAFWLLGGKHVDEYLNDKKYLQVGNPAVEVKKPSIAFGEAGIYVLRENSTFVSITLGHVAANGKGNHSHNDALSVEIALDGESFIVDPGSYVYTQDYLKRNDFRSTKAHNAPLVDGAETNLFNETQLFRMTQQSKSRVLEWKTMPVVIFEGECIRSGESSSGLIHNRRIKLAKDGNLVILRDQLHGNRKCLVTMRLTLAAGIVPELFSTTPSIVKLQGQSHTAFLGVYGEADMKICLRDAWISKSYGSLQAVKAIEFECDVILPWSLDWCLSTDKEIIMQKMPCRCI